MGTNEVGHAVDGDKIPELIHAIGVVSDTLGIVQGTLDAGNPTPEQERALRRLQLRLEVELAVLEAEFDRALNGGTQVQGPTEAQLAEIGELTDEVELLANQSATVSARIALATKVLEVASSILPS